MYYDSKFYNYILAAPAPKSKSTPKKTDKKNKAPECVEPLKDSTVKEGQPATFKCRFSGSPGMLYNISMIVIINALKDKRHCYQ